MLGLARLESAGPANPVPMPDFSQAKNFLDQHDEQVDQALDKGGDAAKGRFAGHDEQIDQGVDKAQEFTGGRDTSEPQDQPPPA
jgi:antitoxin protein of toxin-antitoxin system